MSDPTPVDLSDLQFMPDWLKGGAGKAKPGSGEPAKGKGRSARDAGDNRKKGSTGGKNPHGNFEQRGRSDNRNRRHFDDRNKGGRRDAKGNRKPYDSRNRRDNRPSSPPPPEGISAALKPGKPSVTQLVDQIRKTARAYSVFDIARLILAARDRYSISFKRDNEDSPELFTCIPDQSAWLSHAEALANLLHTSSFSEHYEEEKVQGEMPKGNYNAIAICGISGKLIGPPNHHSYQSNIANLHRQRFSSMPIGKYKSSIRVERDEETIERWKNEQSIEYHYTSLKTAEGEIPTKFESREEAEKHFLQEHAPSLIKRADEAIVAGNIPAKNLSPGLLTLLRKAAANAQKHPASLVQPLCGMLGAEELKFFKRGKKIFTSITRPKPLSDDSTLSKPILAIVQHIRKRKRASIKSILKDLAPSPVNGEKTQENTAEDSSAPPVENNTESIPQEEKEHAAPAPDQKEHKDKAIAGKSSPEPKSPELTTEQITVMKDLHWLLSEGAVIAFGDGHIELATPRVPDNKKKPGESPPKEKQASAESQTGKEKSPDPEAIDSPGDSQDAPEGTSAAESPDP
jgi:hypothetical protein